MRQKAFFIIQVLGFMIMLTSAREPTVTLPPYNIICMA